MGKSSAISFAVREIPHIIPIDEESARQLCEQILSEYGEDPQAIAEKFMDILGPEDASLNFVLQFTEKLSHEESEKASKSALSPKPSTKNDTFASRSGRQGVNKPESAELRKSEEPSGVPAAPKANAPRKAVVRPSTRPNPKESSKKASKTRKVQSLTEIDDILKALELEQTESDPTKYACNCQGTRHPLFEVAPNCLSCGKIICLREGLNLNHCTFCHTEFLSAEERAQIIEVLNQEKQDLESSKPVAALEKPKKPKGYKITSGAGTNLFSEQDKLFDRVEKERQRELKRAEVLEGIDKEQSKAMHSQNGEDNADPELKVAQERLEKLLHFQDTSAQRTKIIDNASDFSMSNDGSVWGSAQDRALLLKKQQRNMRRWEKLERERHGGRDKVVMDLSIGKDGKVTMTEARRAPKTAHAFDEENVEDISDEEDLQDLQEITELKSTLMDEKKRIDKDLESNVWDPEKDKKQFQKPVYVNNESEISPEKGKPEKDGTRDRGWKNRVQISQGDENSLEQNILAVL
ncbi:Rqt4p [Lachancea thermotolerans CBS 6340]|uniref:KLTH0D03168p n=1 Tax=Lachancea thermotolerans (strain ATCC 56472 / CBS 6340 / NRRL Y-8284) TaxID=559295 RepID=C5DG84_LACTC|nr:KLTH0D03168p [Lachancea thermotolerans CBS 6340]CAR22426.1 KLTH0D03168p [Lachancea thermotolerans CBS 6340]